MIEIDAGLPAELVPLSWLIGRWEGAGVVSYPVEGQTRTLEFGQRIEFSHGDGAYLAYGAHSWLQDGQQTPLAQEGGFWRLSRPPAEADPGPGMLPGAGEGPYPNAERVETLRTPEGDFEIEASILHPSGVSELYLGRVRGGRVDLATDAVMRPSSAKEQSASTRMYGLVEGDLLWAWDLAALGAPLTSHASARLSRVD